MYYSTIAHISDLHFGRHESTAPLALEQSLTAAKPDFLVASGDLSEHGRKTEVHQALQFLVGIANTLSAAGHVCRLIIVPGNHDMGITRSRGGWNGAFADDSLIPSIRDVDQTLSQYYHRQNKDPVSADRLTEVAGAACQYYPAHGLAFLKFDSNMLGHQPWDIARGRVGGEQILTMRAVLSDYAQAYGNIFNRSRKIAVVHHHVQYLPDTEADGLLLMKDAGDFWRAMLDMDVELILHGHKHYAAQMVLRNYQHGEFREIAILAAGAATAKSRPRNQACSYYLIKCSPFRFSVSRQVLTGVFSDDGATPVEFFHQPHFIIPKAAGADPIDARALALMMTPEAEEIDSSHKYLLIIGEATIDKTYSYHGSYEFTGTNISDQPTSYITIPLVVVGAPKLTHGDFRATDLVTQNELPSPEVRYTSINKLQIKLLFAAPVLPGHSFSVKLTFCLRDVMYPRRDYDAFNFTRFANGIATLEYTIRSEYTIVGARLYSVYPDGLSEDQGALEQIDQSHSAWRTTLQNPAGLGMLVYYERLD